MLGAVLMFTALALVGPTGLRALSDADGLLEKRQAELAEISAERDRIANRVELLDPDNVDPDLAGELVRSNLNVVHPDEVVVPRD